VLLLLLQALPFVGGMYCRKTAGGGRDDAAGVENHQAADTRGMPCGKMHHGGDAHRATIISIDVQQYTFQHAEPPVLSANRPHRLTCL
jgi:hypothetical protein